MTYYYIARQSISSKVLPLLQGFHKQILATHRIKTPKRVGLISSLCGYVYSKDTAEWKKTIVLMLTRELVILPDADIEESQMWLPMIRPDSGLQTPSYINVWYQGQIKLQQLSRTRFLLEKSYSDGRLKMGKCLCSQKQRTYIPPSRYN